MVFKEPWCDQLVCKLTIVCLGPCRQICEAGEFIFLRASENFDDDANIDKNTRHKFHFILYALFCEILNTLVIKINREKSICKSVPL